MTDHDKLREAIKLARQAAIPNGNWSMQKHEYELMAVLADAAESTLPKTKMVEVWRVEFAQANPHGTTAWEAASASFPERAMAEKYEWTVKQWPKTSCIRVTGPHQQEVPVS